MPTLGGDGAQEALQRLAGESGGPGQAGQTPDLNPSGGDESGSSARTGFADDFDAFLNMLTTQLQNQNPMEPMDSQKFTQQLVRFTGVEQQIATNEKLDKIVAQTSNDGGPQQAVSYLDKAVMYRGDTVQKTGDSTPLGYELSEDAAQVTISLVNGDGETVRRMNAGAAESGLQETTWSGTDDTGAQVPDGRYSVQVDARDSEGNVIEANPLGYGRVQGADLTGEQPSFNVNGQTMAADQFLQVRLPDS